MFLSCYFFCLTVQNYKIYLNLPNFTYKKCNFIYKFVYFAKWTLQNRGFILLFQFFFVPLRGFLKLNVFVFFM